MIGMGAVEAATQRRWKSQTVETMKLFITPRMASEMLESNVGNRPISRSHLAAIESVFIRGEMAMNGSTISFDVDGRLVNGQHRLTACVNTGIGFWCLVVTGLPKAAFDSIDTISKGRGVSDILAISEVPNAHNVAAVARCVWQFAKTGQVYGSTVYGCHGFTPTLSRRILDLNPEIGEMVRQAKAVAVWKSASLATVATVFFKVSHELCAEFLETMQRGGNPSSPFNVLREWAIRERSNNRRLNDRVAAAKAIKAWNARSSDRAVCKLQWALGDEFPAVSGLDYSTLPSWIGD